MGTFSMAVSSMKSVLRTLWRRLGSIHLTVALCLLLALDLSWGYLCLKDAAPFQIAI